MAGISVKLGTLALLAVAAASAPSGIARAEGPFDGSWVIEAQAVGGHVRVTGRQACSAFTLPVEIKDSKVVGRYAPSNDNPTEIVASQARGSSPMTGSVAEDGTFAASWEAYHIVGKISGDALEAFWTGQCGPRSAQGKRVK